MVVSQIGSWLYISKSQATNLYLAVWQLSLFYAAWALYKKIFLGDEHELGHVSFGLLALASFTERKWWAMAANVVVLANFALAIIIILSFDAKTLAQMVKNDGSPLGVAWAFTFDVYIVSSFCLWSYVLYRFYQLPQLTPYTTLPSTRTS